ncbi:hypothetical protein ACLB2K_040822 [Fragaria x ananassa]
MPGECLQPSLVSFAGLSHPSFDSVVSAGKTELVMEILLLTWIGGMISVKPSTAHPEGIKYYVIAAQTYVTCRTLTAKSSLQLPVIIVEIALAMLLVTVVFLIATYVFATSYMPAVAQKKTSRLQCVAALLLFSRKTFTRFVMLLHGSS